ncbi:hypothetical protein C2I06_09425 [Niallia circulans]|uniref:hypothetical protein n=1 Tax=Niallia circulans TaxID=1397 RepID=UPI000F45365E|nr:hypothetical protein [Niallia circulans]AYV67078.1 hypothetical protein C2I06_09425 [Niallia circulans]
MLNQLEINLTQQIINNFISAFRKNLEVEIKKLKSNNLKVEKILPKVLIVDFGCEVTFSIEKGHIMFVLKHNKNRTSTNFIIGDVIDVFDDTGLWAAKKVLTLFSLSDCKYIEFKKNSFNGVKPFSLNGDDIEMYMEDVTFVSPSGKETEVEFAFVFSYSKLISVINEIESFTSNFIFAYWNYFDRFKAKLDSTSDKYKEYISHLKSISTDMDYYFYDEKVLERDIEKFINENSIIISEILGLEKPIVQPKLKDIKQIYNQKLIPDLMGFDSTRDNWTIVDYKTGRRANLVNSPGGVRVKFSDAVAKLEAQLRIYRKYFNELEHREYFNKEYNTKVHEYPHTIGIIGYVDKESRKDFNELLDEKGRWFELIPYNDLQARFKKLIDLIERIK